MHFFLCCLCWVWNRVGFSMWRSSFRRRHTELWICRNSQLLLYWSAGAARFVSFHANRMPTECYDQSVCVCANEGLSAFGSRPIGFSTRYVCNNFELNGGTKICKIFNWEIDHAYGKWWWNKSPPFFLFYFRERHNLYNFHIVANEKHTLIQ